MDIKSLADSDEQEVVREVQEFFADYLAVNQHVFSLNIAKCGIGFKWSEPYLKRSAQGIISVLLSLKKSPLIRYQNSSDMCKKLAESVRVRIFNSIFIFMLLNL